MKLVNLSLRRGFIIKILPSETGIGFPTINSQEGSTGVYKYESHNCTTSGQQHLNNYVAGTDGFF